MDLYNIFKDLEKNNDNEKAKYMEKYMETNFLSQVYDHLREKVKEELLEEIIVNNLEQDEFFINKAIGWTLRDYSKTNPEWVTEFIDRHRAKLSKLSIKEASKYI